jgi:hypothetical protein
MSQILWSLTAIGSLFAIIFILTRPQSECRGRPVSARCAVSGRILARISFSTQIALRTLETTRVGTLTSVFRDASGAIKAARRSAGPIEPRQDRISHLRSASQH